MWRVIRIPCQAELWREEKDRDKKSSSNGATVSCWVRALRRVLKTTVGGQIQTLMNHVSTRVYRVSFIIALK